MSLISQDGNIVLATPSYGSYGFELTTATQQVTAVQSGFFTTYKDVGEGEVDTTHAESGSKSYLTGHEFPFNSPSQVYFNSIFGSDTYIVNMSFWIYLDGQGNDGAEILDFQLNGYEGSYNLRLGIFGVSLSKNWYQLMYYDHNDAWQNVFEGLLSDTWNFIYFNYDDNDSVVYGCINDSVVYETSPVQPRNVRDRPTWKNLYIYGDVNYENDKYVWIDNFNVTFDDEPWWGGVLGDITINVFNESNISQAVTSWDVFVKSSVGAILYSLTGQSNPVVIDLYNIGFGDRIFEFYADGYYERYYFLVDDNKIVSGANHTLTAYLPPTGLANLYYIQVVDGAASPIYNVFIDLSRNFNGTIYDIASGYTDVFGMYPIYLIGSQQYAINLSHSNYDSFYGTFIPDPNSYGYENPIIFTMGSQTANYTNETIFWEVIDFSAYITGGILYVNFTDSTGETTNTSISIWEHNSSNSSNPALFHRDTRSDDNDFQLSYTVNTSNCYSITLDLNHTIFGYTHQYIDAICVRTGITTKTTFDDLLDLNFKYNPFGWSNTFGFFILIASLFSFGQHNVGVSMLFTGGILSFINSVIGLSLLTVSVPVVIIALGVLVLWGEHGK